MEVHLQSFTRITQEIDKSSLLNKVVLSVETDIFHLFLRFLQVLHLLLLASISPLTDHLLALVLGVGVVESTELWSEHE